MRLRKWHAPGNTKSERSDGSDVGISHKWSTVCVCVSSDSVIMSQFNKRIFHVRESLSRTKIRVVAWHVYTCVHISQTGEYRTSKAIKLRQLCLFGFCQRIYCSLNVTQSAQTHWLRGFLRGEKRHCICAVINSIINNNTNNYLEEEKKPLDTSFEKLNLPFKMSNRIFVVTNCFVHYYFFFWINFAIANVKKAWKRATRL